MARFELTRQMLTIEDALPGGKVLLRKGLIVSIVRNPLAGVYVSQIEGLTDDLRPIALAMTRRLIAAMEAVPERITAFGGGAMVGAAGTPDQAGLWQGPASEALRQMIGDERAVVPFTKKAGGPGQHCAVAMGAVGAHAIQHAADQMDLAVADAPRAEEMLLAVAVGAVLQHEA